MGMASIWKRHDSGKFWIACYTDTQGRQRKVSTKIPALEKNRGKALRVADELEMAHKKRLTASQIVTLCGNLVKDLTGEDMKTVSVRGFVEDYLRRKRGEISPKTLAAYEQCTKTFLEWLGAAAEEDMFRVEQKHILSFREHLRKSVAVATTNKLMKYLKVFFRDARAARVIVENPFDGVAILKKESGGSGRRGFTVDELRVVMREAVGTEWESLVRFGLYTGQRLGDLVNLRWSQVDLVADEIRWATRKTGRVVVVPLCLPLREHILSIAGCDDPGGFVHPEAAKMAAQSLSNQFGEILVRCGFREKKSHRKDKERQTDTRKLNELSFHSLRHSAVSLMKNAGISPAVVQDLIGHDSEAVSRVYTKIETEAKRKAVDALPVI
jgi:integrase